MLTCISFPGPFVMKLIGFYHKNMCRCATTELLHGQLLCKRDHVVQFPAIRAENVFNDITTVITVFVITGLFTSSILIW